MNRPLFHKLTDQVFYIAIGFVLLSPESYPAFVRTFAAVGAIVVGTLGLLIIAAEQAEKHVAGAGPLEKQ